MMQALEALKAAIGDIVIPGKGILAADESINTIGKRFAKINLENTEENRRAYRELLLTTSGLENYISGVILHEETLRQTTADNQPFPDLLAKKGIVPGIKVDQGLAPLIGGLSEEKTTQGLDGLAERLEEFKKLGARFAKWRVIYSIASDKPSGLSIENNAYLLARYAAICQAAGLVPIVEPEVLMDGNHDIERCAAVTEQVLHKVFKALYEHGVQYEWMILKPNMVISGANCPEQAEIEQVAKQTLQVLYRCVPAAVPSIHFLSGGQSADLAIAHLQAMNQERRHPWLVSFSYGRALQDDCLRTWQGLAGNQSAAQSALLERARLNAAATLGQ